MSRSTARRDGGEIALLTAMLAGLPNLRDAACSGSPGLFDGRDADEDVADARYRHEAAVQLCRRCPALAACRQWADTQPDQIQTVIGGRVPAGAGRPRKDAA